MTDDQTELMRAKPDLINEYLEQSLDKDILVYVHGANTNVYRGAAMAAQYRHFTGHNSMVIPFLWPSTGRLIRYGKDVVHAQESVPAFINLIEYLSHYTNAENINILAYSAGSQIVSESLAQLGMEKEGVERKNLRIGDVYYAAADISVDLFAENLKSYKDIPHNVTLTINEKDSVLKHTERYHRVSRAGKPNPDDLSEETIEWLQKISRESWYDVLSVDRETVSELPKGAHDFWYSHPWVSSDVLLYFLFQARPAERGLLKNHTDNGLQYWTFPPDYRDSVIEIIQNENRTE